MHPPGLLRWKGKDEGVASLLGVCHAYECHSSCLSQCKWSWESQRQLMQHLWKWLNSADTNDFIVLIDWTGGHIQNTAEKKPSIFHRVWVKPNALQNEA